MESFEIGVFSFSSTYAAFEQIDSNILRAARTLGASEGTVFWQVTLPLATPGLMAGTILAFARALGEFGATLMLAGNIPGKTETMSARIWWCCPKERRSLLAPKTSSGNTLSQAL